LLDRLDPRRPWPRKWLRRLAKVLLWWRIRPRRHSRIWIDVGAHEGETTLPFAAANPWLIVYAFEPNPAAAVRAMGRLRNFVVLPFAIAESDGIMELNLTAYEQASSLLPVDSEAASHWIEGDKLAVVGHVKVPTMRLDTFMDSMGLRHVDFLKVDAQGADFQVVRSAGRRLADIDRIQLEVSTLAERPYRGSHGREEVVAYMAERGFRLFGAEEQSHGQESNLTFVRDP
jgi:FkbM family methyltransferase